MKSIGIIVLSAVLAYSAVASAQGYDHRYEQRTQDLMQQEAQIMERQRIHNEQQIQQQIQQGTMDRMYEQQQQMNNNSRQVMPGYMPPRYVPRY